MIQKVRRRVSKQILVYLLTVAHKSSQDYKGKLLHDRLQETWRQFHNKNLTLCSYMLQSDWILLVTCLDLTSYTIYLSAAKAMLGLNLFMTSAHAWCCLE